MKKYIFAESDAAEKDNYKKICMALVNNYNKSQNELYFITFDGKLYAVGYTEGSGAAINTLLEKLPQGYEYTALYANNSTLYAAWEEQMLFLTGFCGLLTIDLNRILIKD
jgi:hypothetical protein